MTTLHRCMLRLYPKSHREEFDDEMLAVLSESRAGLQTGPVFSRWQWSAGEAFGLLAGAMREYVRGIRSESDICPREIWYAIRVSISESDGHTDDDHPGGGGIDD